MLLFFALLEAKAEKVYEFNSLCQQAYKEITQLKLNNGLVLIEKAKKQNPDNLIPLILESYVDFFILFFNELIHFRIGWIDWRKNCNSKTKLSIKKHSIRKTI